MIATVGQPVQATLRISHTRHWASPPTSPSEPIDFIYTLEANPETWLLAGQRRAHFSANDGEVHEWPILLIPLKTGVTLLPNVDIRMRPNKEKENTETNCEIDYLSYGETFVVVPDVRTSTVGIGDMSKGREGSVVWLESTGIEA
jgi:trafficking protein particle complex subunit 10